MITRGVIFDMDGVLVDSGPAHFRSWQALALEHGGQTITPAQFSAAFGQRSSEMIASWFGVQDPVETRRLDDRKEAIYRDLIRGRVPAMNGAIACVRRLHAAGLRLAIGSSGPVENVNLVCEEMGLLPFLSTTITGGDVSRGKPDPQVFELAADRLGLAAEACVVIEDAPSGVEAARRAGMRCVALAQGATRAAVASANRIVGHLDEVTPELLLSLVGPGRDECPSIA